ncbi:MAG: SIS domain-containing protein [Armatimonadota bacterium]|nr:SIS domain-containing protein [Armatimonadota bacterium]MDR7485922.1 SIS domain-containing protein [Armatimonadota bacterium]MDR7533127.1 SIS domain-containing protein [Armatimonadota bacterium]MDR7536627.1 SIS domain-containing protein [Armatimonadota bacterium]
MRAQIQSQPDALEALLARHDEIRATAGVAAAGARRLWATGHGDSYFAPLAAADVFRRYAGVPYQPLLAQELAAYPPADLGPDDLVIVLSASGAVGASVAAARVARTRGARVLAVTNAPASPLAREADRVVALGIAEPAPFLAGTVTYTASLLVLMLLAVVPDSAPAGDLRAAVAALPAALALEGAIRGAVGAHAPTAIWHVLGMGCQEATARYGAAKLVEVADIVGIAHETEEFFHEHHWVVRTEQPVVLVAHDAPSSQRAAAAALHLHELGVPVWLVGGAPGGDVHLSLPEVAPWASPLVAAVPLQWLAYWAARARGLDPDRRSHLRGSARYEVSRKYRYGTPPGARRDA